MSTVDRYILRLVLKPLLVAVCIALLILMTERLVRMLDLVLSFNGSPSLVAEMMIFLLPHYLGLALPGALFLGVMLAFRAMQENSELAALGAMGIGLQSLFRPIAILALSFMTLALINAAYAQPYSRYLYRSLVHFITDVSFSLVLQQRNFLEVGEYTFTAQPVGSGGRRYSKIFVYQINEDGGSMTVTAKRGTLSPLRGALGVSLALEDGVRMLTGPQVVYGADPALRAPGDLSFDRSDVSIEYKTADNFRTRGLDEREMTLIEIWQSRNSPPLQATTSDLVAEFNDRLVRALYVFFLPFLAIGLAVGQPRVHRAYKIGAGLILLIGYNELVGAGKLIVAEGHLTPLVGLWLPFSLFAAISLYVYFRRAHLVPRAGVGVLTNVEMSLRAFWSRLSSFGS